MAHTGDATRFPDQGHYASHNDTAPTEASSGDLRRHRLNCRGNRQLNRALHIMAIAQIRHNTDSRAYYPEKLAEHKTEREAPRALKRQPSNLVYRTLSHDHQTGESSGRGESHPPALTEPDVNLSAHPAPAIQPHGVSPRRQCANKPGCRLATALRNW
ncbi:MAG: transposase [Egibacteraceae bacterium]